MAMKISVPLRSVPISGIVNGEGKIVFINWLCHTSRNGVAVFCLTQVRYTKPNSNFNPLLPSNSPLINERGITVRDGLTFLGYGRSVLTPKEAKFHIANAQGSIIALTAEEFQAFVASHANVPIVFLDRRCVNNLSNLRWSSPDWYVIDPSMYSNADFGISGLTLQLLDGIDIKQGYTAPLDMRGCKHEGTAFTQMTLQRGTPALIIPQNILTPLVKAVYNDDDLDIAFPDYVINYGLHIDMANLQVTMPNKVLGDADIKLRSCDLPRQFRVPYANNANIFLQGVSGVESLYVQATSPMYGTNKVMLYVVNTSIKSLTIDLCTNTCLILRCHDSLDELILRNVQTGEVVSVPTRGMLYYTDHNRPIAYSSIGNISKNIAFKGSFVLRIGLVTGRTDVDVRIFTEASAVGAPTLGYFLR